MTEEELHHYFRKFDADFQIGPAAPVVYRGTDVLIQTQMELPVPMVKGSRVFFKFTTRQGDIAFSLHFSTGEDELETVSESQRVPSDMQPHEGTYKATKSYGILLLIFDNSYSFFTSKFITYEIDLYAPDLAETDLMRSTKGQQLLKSAVDNVKRAEVVLSHSKKKMHVLKSEIAQMEGKAAAMRLELAQRKQQLDQVGHPGPLLHLPSHI